MTRQFAFYTKREEVVNAWSHFAGIVIGAAVGIGLLIKSFPYGALAVFSVTLYIVGMLFSYFSSTFYHRQKFHSRLRPILRQFDHAAIYWHIAGSYSPIALIPLLHKGAWGWSLFIFMWASTAIGSILSFRKMEKHSYIETICFLVMGLSGLIALKPLFECVPITTLYWIFAEGFFYVVGAIFYSFPSFRYMHSIFHFFVLGGTICHLIAIWKIL